MASQWQTDPASPPSTSSPVPPRTTRGWSRSGWSTTPPPASTSSTTDIPSRSPSRTTPTAQVSATGFHLSSPSAAGGLREPQPAGCGISSGLPASYWGSFTQNTDMSCLTFKTNSAPLTENWIDHHVNPPFTLRKTFPTPAPLRGQRRKNAECLIIHDRCVKRARLNAKRWRLSSSMRCIGVFVELTVVLRWQEYVI